MTRAEYQKRLRLICKEYTGEEKWRKLSDLETAYNAALMAKIRKLKSQTIVWHKYPDEKPKPSYEYEVNIPLIVVVEKDCPWTGTAYYNTESGNFWHGSSKVKDVLFWAYLPAPPEGAK